MTFSSLSSLSSVSLQNDGLPSSCLYYETYGQEDRDQDSRSSEHRFPSRPLEQGTRRDLLQGRRGQERVRARRRSAACARSEHGESFPTCFAVIVYFKQRTEVIALYSSPRPVRILNPNPSDDVLSSLQSLRRDQSFRLWDSRRVLERSLWERLAGRAADLGHECSGLVLFGFRDRVWVASSFLRFPTRLHCRSPKLT